MSASPEQGGFVPVAKLGDLQFRPGASVMFEGKEIALFPIGEDPALGLRGIDGSCPHAGGPLATGDLEGNAVACPWHSWAFDLDDGSCEWADHPLTCYEVRIDGDEVAIRPRT